MNSHVPKFEFSLNIWWDFIYSTVVIWQPQREKDLIENFKAITDWDRLESKHSVRKIYKIEKSQLPYFFGPISNRYYIKQNLVAPSELVVTKFHCTKGMARGLVVSDLRSETKGSRFESKGYPCAEVSSLQ